LERVRVELDALAGDLRASAQGQAAGEGERDAAVAGAEAPTAARIDVTYGLPQQN
jgi:hypothetical protein